MKVASLFIFAVLFMVSSAMANEIPVNEIQVDGLYSIGKDELLYLLDLSPGMPTDVETVREGIKRAFLKGIFEQISVEADDEIAGLIMVIVREKDVVEEIKIKGTDQLSKRFIEKHFNLKENSRVHYNKLDDTKLNLLKAIRERGFSHASLSIAVNETDEPYRVEIVLRIDEGEPELIKDIRITGRPDSEVRKNMSIYKWEVYDQFKLRKELEKLKEHYRKQKYLEPTVNYRFEDGVLFLEVHTGKMLDVDFKGNEKVGSKKLLEVLPFIYSRNISEDVVEEAVFRLLSLYHELGYPSAQIAPILSTEEDLITLTFYIFEGNKILIESIDFTGASIPERKLKEIMSLKEVSAYNPDALTDDVNRIREFYNALGYIDVKIAEPAVKISDTWARIQIEISEGAQVRFVSVGVEGAETIPDAELFKSLSIKSGDPYNEVDISDARRNLLKVCRNNGYLDCKVLVSRDINIEGARIVFVVSEGKKYKFGKTIVTGNRLTKYKVFEREFLYKDGEPFNPTKLSDTRQDLYRLNLFSIVDTKPLESKDDTVDVKLEVEEAKAGTVEFGGGYGQYERFRGFLDISYRNLFGMNRTISARTEQSSLASRYLLNYHEPYLFGRKIESRSFLLAEEREERNIDTGETRYRIRRYSATTGVEKALTKRTKVGLFYEYSLVETFEVQPDVILSREDTGTLAISSMSPSITYDTRDNPFDPKRGIFAGLTVKLATKELVSETDFVKATAHASTYHRLTRWMILALALRGGAAQGYRDTDELPLVERFFLGGRNTVRGFDQDELGPKSDEGRPTGGNAFVLGNIELRTIITGSWRIVGFVDIGSVWVEVDEVALDGLRYTAGLGLQYNTPVGPLRLDYGHKLDRKEGESRGELHFSIGHAF